MMTWRAWLLVDMNRDLAALCLSMQLSCLFTLFLLLVLCDWVSERDLCLCSLTLSCFLSLYHLRHAFSLLHCLTSSSSFSLSRLHFLCLSCFTALGLVLINFIFSPLAFSDTCGILSRLWGHSLLFLDIEFWDCFCSLQDLARLSVQEMEEHDCICW